MKAARKSDADSKQSRAAVNPALSQLPADAEETFHGEPVIARDGALTLTTYQSSRRSPYTARVRDGRRTISLRNVFEAGGYLSSGRSFDVTIYANPGDRRLLAHEATRPDRFSSHPRGYTVETLKWVSEEAAARIAVDTAFLPSSPVARTLLAAVDVFFNRAPERRLLEAIDKTPALFHEGFSGWRSAEEIQQAILTGPAKAKARRILSFPGAAGTYLAKLKKSEPDRIEKKHSNRGNRWNNRQQ